MMVLGCGVFFTSSVQNNTSYPALQCCTAAISGSSPFRADKNKGTSGVFSEMQDQILLQHYCHVDTHWAEKMQSAYVGFGTTWFYFRSWQNLISFTNSLLCCSFVLFYSCIDGLFDIGGAILAVLNWVCWHFDVYFGEGWTNMPMFLKDKLALLLSSLSHRCPPSSWYLCATKIKCATQTVRVVFKPGEKQT